MFRIRSISLALFLSLTLTALGTILMLALLFSLSLTRGFNKYVEQFELTRLGHFEQHLVTHYQEHMDWSFVHTPEDMFPERPPLKNNESPNNEPPPNDNHPGRPDENPRANQPPPPPENTDRDLGPRLALFNAQGNRIVGRPEAEDHPQRAIKLADGTVIGYLALAPAGGDNNRLMREFLGNQTRNIVLGSLFAILLAACAAFFLARYFRKPIAALATGAQQLAAGNLSTRVELNRYDELGELAQDFNKMAQKLERFEQARQQWVADTSHELRTPLTILRAHTDAMRDGVMPLDQRGLGRIDSAINDLDRLVADLYQLARSDIGMHDYLMESINVSDLFDDLNDKFSEPLSKTGLTLEIATAPDLILRGDAGRLNQLFSNLLSNSMRYTNSGGLVRLTAKANGNVADIRLDDSLPGVPDAALPLLFERFYRVDASHSRRSGGSGLGLSICESIVKGHGGTICAKQSALGGLQIQMSLPLANKL